MNRYFLLAVVLLGYTLPQVPEPYPGQSQHQEPPKGWFCAHNDPRPAHTCECKQMSKATPEDPFCEATPITETDKECKSYCWAQHCHCDPVCKKEGQHVH